MNKLVFREEKGDRLLESRMEMSKVRVLIVDDSPFSQAVIKRTLEEQDFEICGLAETGQEALRLFAKLQPDVVTMDINMPDMDGMECSKRILSLDKDARIIILSAMKHNSLIAQARNIGIAAFLQKPINQEELCTTILNICQVGKGKEEESWQERFSRQLLSSLRKTFPEVTGLKCKFWSPVIQEEKFISQGVTTVIGLGGYRQGRMLLDCTLETATKLTEQIMKKAVEEEDILNCLSELANILCGHIVSKFNNTYQVDELKITPPSILFGGSIAIINRKFQSFLVAIETEIGIFNVSVGFMGGA